MLLFRSFFIYCALVLSAIRLSGQTDTLPTVLTIYPKSGEAYEPVFTPFCADHCWLSGSEFDLIAGRYLSPGEPSCVPPEALLYDNATSPDDIGREPLRWVQDPYISRFCWTYDYHRDHVSAWGAQRDTLFIYRYDRVTRQQKAFRTLTQAEMLIGRAGIWVCNQDAIVMYDKQNGKELVRIKNPFESDLMLWLRNWGDDVVISERLIYRSKTGKIEPFFPLPTDMEGCKAPDKVEFYQEATVTTIYEGNDDYGLYAYVPNRSAIKLPLKSYNHFPLKVLHADPQRLWMLRRDTLWSYGVADGALSAYPIGKCEPVNGNKGGRFLCFYNEKGLIFFDKNTCETRVLPMPYGYEAPNSYCSFNSKILLYSIYKQWDLVAVEKLDTEFKTTDLQKQYEEFEPESARFVNLPDDFYLRYEAFMTIKRRYGVWNNPKINRRLVELASYFISTMYHAPDSLMDHIAIDFASGKLDTILSCPVTEGLFTYYAFKGALFEIRQLLLYNPSCAENLEFSNGQLLMQVNRTLYQLDSIGGLSLAPDERLYATGKIWLEYCLIKRWIRISDPYADLEQAFNYYRDLMAKYPNSQWVDNAAYDMMYYIDYHPQDTSDDMPDSDPDKAIEAFSQFLIDYPGSDCKPMVLYRTLKAMGYIASFSSGHLDEVQAYIDSISLQYPDFAQKKSIYKFQNFVLNERWNERWNLLAHISSDTFHLENPVYVEVRLLNKSGSTQLLDTSFLNHWNVGLSMHLSQIATQGCDAKWGDFPMSPVSSVIHQQAVEVPPGGSYSERFVLGMVSRNQGYGTRLFTPKSGEVYQYQIGLLPLGVPWLSSSGNSGRIYVH